MSGSIVCDDGVEGKGSGAIGCDQLVDLCVEAGGLKVNRREVGHGFEVGAEGA